MKQKMKPKEMLLLLLPTLGLAGFAVMQRSSAPALVLERAEVSQVRHIKNHVDINNRFDKQVVIILKYNAPTLWGRYVDKGLTVSASAGKSGLSLVDENGKLHSVSADISPVDNTPPLPRYGIKYRFDTTRIPKSAGRITFPAVISVNDSQLSVPVVVRNK